MISALPGAFIFYVLISNNHMQIIDQTFDTALTIDGDGNYICLQWQHGDEVNYKMHYVDLGPMMDYKTWLMLNETDPMGQLEF